MKTIFVHTIYREEIENNNIKRFIDRFGFLPDAEPDKLLQYCDAVVFRVDGYDETQEELYMIPQVRSYFRRITGYWPYWLYALRLEDESAKVPILSLLAAVSTAKRSESEFVAATFAPEELGDLLLTLFPWMNLLCERADLGEEYIRHRTAATLATFFPEGLS